MGAFSVHGSVRFRSVGDEAVVLSQERAEVLVLNEVGSRILHLVDGQRSGAELAEQLCREFEVTPRAARQDVEEFLQQLAEAGIVQELDREPSPP